MKPTPPAWNRFVAPLAYALVGVTAVIFSNPEDFARPHVRSFGLWLAGMGALMFTVDLLERGGWVVRRRTNTGRGGHYGRWSWPLAMTGFLFSLAGIFIASHFRDTTIDLVGGIVLVFCGIFVYLAGRGLEQEEVPL